MPLLPVSDIFAFPVLLKVLHRQTFACLISGILQTGNIGISDRKLANKNVAKSQEMDIWKFSKWSHCTNIYLKCMPFVHDMQLNIPIMYSLFMRRQNSQQCNFLGHETKNYIFMGCFLKLALALAHVAQDTFVFLNTLFGAETCPFHRNNDHSANKLRGFKIWLHEHPL